MIQKQTGFVHLHVHSDFSFCEDAAKIKSLVDRAEELGMRYLTLTDHAICSGLWNFLRFVKTEKTRFIP